MRIITKFDRVKDFETYFEFTDTVISSMTGFDKDNPNINNNKDQNFNNCIYKYFSKKLNVLDLGCAHGEMVANFINDGHYAIGIDGCYKYSTDSYWWLKYPINFFVCDLGRPFEIVDDSNNRVIFDLITSWECFEHIKTDDVDILLSNIYNHTSEESMFVGSIGKTKESVHRTLKNREWWNEKFLNFCFEPYNIDIPENFMIRKLPGITDYYKMKRMVLPYYEKAAK